MWTRSSHWLVAQTGLVTPLLICLSGVKMEGIGDLW